MLHVGDPRCLAVEVVHECGISEQAQHCKSLMFEGSALSARQSRRLCVVVVTASSAEAPTRQSLSYRTDLRRRRVKFRTVTLLPVLILIRSSTFACRVRLEGLV
jgi:hypothetical protein